MRLGLFGGSFDPVHNGHLALAESAARGLRLDGVWLIPTAIQPHKRGGPVASDAHRLAMVELAAAERPGLRACAIEIDRGGVSYTIDTLRAVRAEQPEAELLLLMGADTLRDLPAWREPAEVLRLATPAVAARAGEAPDTGVLTLLAPAERIREVAASTFPMPPTPVSSSEVRRRVAAGEPIDGLAPPAVVRYLQAHRLYTRGV